MCMRAHMCAYICVHDVGGCTIKGLDSLIIQLNYCVMIDDSVYLP